MDKILRTRTRFIRPAIEKAWNELFEGSFEQNSRRIFHEHYKKVEGLVPRDRLLIYHVKEGWQPLCEFLNEPIPSVPMPHENEMKLMQRKFRKALLYKSRQQLSSALSTFFFVSFALLVLSALCGDNLVGPKLLALITSAWNMGICFVSFLW